MTANAFAFKEAKTASTLFHCIPISTNVTSSFMLQVLIFIFHFFHIEDLIPCFLNLSNSLIFGFLGFSMAIFISGSVLWCFLMCSDSFDLKDLQNVENLWAFCYFFF